MKLTRLLAHIFDTLALRWVTALTAPPITNDGAEVANLGAKKKALNISATLPYVHLGRAPRPVPQLIMSARSSNSCDVTFLPAACHSPAVL